jgi:signal transduction histidine kinase
MERIFFHDIINTAGSLKSYFDLLAYDLDVDQLAEMLPLLQDSLNQLVGEIQAQRALSMAENGELPVEMSDQLCHEAVESVVDTYRRNDVARGRTLEVDPGCARALIRTDTTLLRRVLGNLTKNALEASTDGDTVRLGCDLDGDRARFWVHNHQHMPPEVQLQVFQRSFSTKGKSRGLGTYSVRLITERYLEGEVEFTSKEGEGTTFVVSLSGVQSAI